MTVQEFYKSISGDYEGVSMRLVKDDRILKYLKRFRDSDDYQNMIKGLEEKDYEIVFRMSHNLKGMSLNLGLTDLQKTSDALCEATRHGKPDINIEPLVEAVKESYRKTLDAVNRLS